MHVKKCFGLPEFDCLLALYCLWAITGRWERLNPANSFMGAKSEYTLNRAARNTDCISLYCIENLNFSNPFSKITSKGLQRVITS